MGNGEAVGNLDCSVEKCFLFSLSLVELLDLVVEVVNGERWELCGSWYAGLKNRFTSLL